MGTATALLLALACAGQRPVADAGADQEVALGEPVRLDGAGLSASGIIAEWRWAVIAAPTGSSVDAPEPVAEPELTPDQPGYFSFALTVTDDVGLESLADAVNVLVLADDLPPIAVVTPEQSPDGDPILRLDASASYDPEGEPLDYEWTLEAWPGDAPPELTSGAEIARLTAGEPGLYVVGLAVSDGLLRSERVDVIWQAPEEAFGED